MSFSLFKSSVPAKKSHQTKELDQANDLDRARTPEQAFVTDAYHHHHEHLLDELRWLNRLLAAHVLRLRRVNFYEGVKDFRRFFIAEEEIDALLSAGVFEEEDRSEERRYAKQIQKLMTQARSIREEIGRRVSETLANGISLPMVYLSRCFNLSEFELQSLIICLAPQIDARYEKLYAYLQNDITKKHPSIELILSLLGQSLTVRLQLLPHFAASAPLLYYRLVERVENGSNTSAGQQFLCATPRLVQYVLGHNASDDRLRSNLRFLSSLSWEEVVVPEALQDRLQKLFHATLDDKTARRPVVYLHGRQGVGKKTIAQALCSEAGVTLAVADIQTLLRSPEYFSEQIRLILCEGILQSCAVYFDHVEKLTSCDRECATFLTTLAYELREWGWLIFLGSELPLPAELLDFPEIVAIEIPPPDTPAQEALWAKHLEGEWAENERRQLKQLTECFDLSGGQIARAVHHAKQCALVRDPERGEITLTDLFVSSRVQSQPKLSSLARKIEPKFRWNDLVLPEDQIAQLHELANQVRHRKVVMSEWGFANKLSLGRGLNALFAGPSGTGKTMAAEVIASDLGLDLYKIDLSAVVSKYIGETEKNLNRIFTDAEHSNAILFFDEADALFGKRSEVRDSHDRYANIEIAYLLQKMEEYEGITILATNLRQNLDEAFTRRIRFIIEFPFPDEGYRLRIWKGIWPKETPLAPEVDLRFVAQRFKLTGGNIRNIALAAAFLATENGRIVEMKHLLQATKRELQKTGKSIREDEFEQYASAFSKNS